MTQQEIRQAAMEHRVVVYRARCSTDISEYRGYISEIGEVYDEKAGVMVPVVVVSDLHANSRYRVAPEDIVRAEQDKPRKVQDDVQEQVEYVVLGRMAQTGEYRVVAERGGRRLGLYRGYMDDEKGRMRLYIKEPYDKDAEGKVVVALSLLRGART
ncbi:MAG: hypothetical protein IIX15_04940 [Clostridia bacterium]|nr:hypothetical protein [Clostridia bacterium]